ncbi:dihydrolipoyl dehydrogenase [Bacillaceae bacterium Marseille-Q3522]|nr:dihydrolipoyl dehydrogenase [Bacillaceae bacterium Marseille-Q3522]
MKKFETMVIGAGPGGYVAAIRAAQLGQKTAIVEAKELGGTCLNVGCIPSKALIEASHYKECGSEAEKIGIYFANPEIDFAKVQAWKAGIVGQLTNGVKSLLKANGVEIITGTASFIDEHTLTVAKETYTFTNCIIATGSVPVCLPFMTWGNRVISSTGALALKEIPRRLTVIGGGYIGIELGTVYANFGTEVTILEGAKDILPSFDKDMSSLVAKKLKKKANVTIITEAKVQNISENALEGTVTAEINGSLQTFTSDYVLVTVGRKPNISGLELDKAGIITSQRGFIATDAQCRTSAGHIYAIGDVTEGIALAHRASMQGKAVAEIISGDQVYPEDYVIPAVVFSEPQLASVGLTEQEAKAKGFKPKVTKFPFAANGRSLTLNDPDGFIKLISDTEDGTLLGGFIAGPNAAELINELAVALQTGLTLEDLALTVHVHPSLGEVIMEAGEKGIGYPVHTL